MKLSGIEIKCSPCDVLPFGVDAIVVEEDTSLALSASTAIVEVAESMAVAAKKIQEQKFCAPGTVVVGTGTPQQFLAIVFDFNAETVCCEEWVRSAYEDLFRRSEQRRISSVSTPLLGTKHRAVSYERSANLLKSAITKRSPKHLTSLWVTAPSEEVEHDIYDALHEISD